MNFLHCLENNRSFSSIDIELMPILMFLVCYNYHLSIQFESKESCSLATSILAGFLLNCCQTISLFKTHLYFQYNDSSKIIYDQISM